VGYSVGVDIGGTFTDFVVYNHKSGDVATEKILTTPDRPSDAIIRGLLNLESKNGIKFNQIERLLHATTLATNALIERKGARVGLLTTEGFEDVLDIRKGMRYNQYDLKIQFPKAYVPRYLRRGVHERVLASGSIRRELSESDVVERVRELTSEGIDSLAVCYIHSYSNPEHEVKTREIVSKSFPDLSVSISSEITTQAREYERTSTTVVDAYIKPMIKNYLNELSKRLESLGFEGKLLIMTCSGGMVEPRVAGNVPVLLLESGPVAGVSISSRIGKRLGLKGIFSFDMGGTTAKGSLLTEGRIEKGYEFEAARVDRFRRGSGIPISVPTVRLIEIGSGGGGIAHVDNLGIVRVGPESAGAMPGPACYELGGQEPTVTDSNLVLGYLDAGYFLGGAMRLNIDLARSAIRASIAEKTGLDVEQSAWAIHERANEDIAAAFRLHASEVGVDYRDYSFVCFGGAGPIHAAMIAKKLGVRRVIIPPRAGVLSAEGLLSTPLSIDVSQTKRYELADLEFENYKQLFDEIIERASSILRSAGIKKNDLVIARKLDMCYHGQGYEIPVNLRGFAPNRSEFSKLADLFERAYKTKYSISGLFSSIDIASFKVTVSARMKEDSRFTNPEMKSNPVEVDAKSRRRRKTAFDPNLMRFRNFEVVRRAVLKRAEVVLGPALIQEVESTTVVPSKCVASVDLLGNLVVSVEG
jgi:N-methylhydantoinase A